MTLLMAANKHVQAIPAIRVKNSMTCYSLSFIFHKISQKFSVVSMIKNEDDRIMEFILYKHNLNNGIPLLL